MSGMLNDFIIQISTSAMESGAATAANKQGKNRGLISELQSCLQPGVEIALVFDGYAAMTSILWLSDLQPDGSLRARVRFLGVSALPAEPARSVSILAEASSTADSAHADSAIASQQP